MFWVLELCVFSLYFRPQILSNSLLKWCNSSLQLPDIHIPVGAGRSKPRLEAQFSLYLSALNIYQDFYTQTEPIQPSSKANMSCFFLPTLDFLNDICSTLIPPGLWSKRCGRCLCSCLQCTLDLDKKTLKTGWNGRKVVDFVFIFSAVFPVLSSYLLVCL